MRFYSIFKINGIQLIAILEGAKGLLVLITGFGLLSLIHKDLHLAAVKLVLHMHINPASHYPEIFLNLASRMTDAQLWAIAFDATLYAVIRFAEAIGLWMKKNWAKWLGIFTSGIYIPYEFYEILQRISWPRITVFLMNIIIVAYLLFVGIKPIKRNELL